MYIERSLLTELKQVKAGKIVILFGPRRVGKTTILKKYLEDKTSYLFVTGEDVYVQEFLASSSIDKLKDFIGNHALLVIDEAQYIPDIGQNLKLIADHIPHVQVIATGSSTFDLAKHVGEPLTGRKITFQVLPLSQIELSAIENRAATSAHLEKRLIYGSYPEVVTSESPVEREAYLRDLVSSYLLKDILAFEGVQKSKKLRDLLVLLAFQIGKEVSHSELATQLSISKNTVDRYLDLLEQVFVLFNVRGFSRNLRKEVTKNSRYYFCDNGIRNALINHFNPLHLRDDIGMLWENYLVSERIKKQHAYKLFSTNYFWRTYDQKELDWIEERDGKLFGYEFKWKGKVKAPKLWLETYSQSSFECITQENYLDFIS